MFNGKHLEFLMNSFSSSALFLVFLNRSAHVHLSNSINSWETKQNAGEHMQVKLIINLFTETILVLNFSVFNDVHRINMSDFSLSCFP